MSILLVGATGSLGQKFVEVARETNTPLIVVLRPSSAKDEAKRKLVEGFEVREADLKDEASLLEACKGVEAVIGLTGSFGISDQLNLVKAASQAGVKRFIPSEFSCDLNRPESSEMLSFEEKMEVRKAVRATAMEWTCVQANAFMTWFGPGCFNMLSKDPSKVEVYAGGDTPLTLTDMRDVARVTLLVALDPRAANRHVNVQFPPNTLTQNQMIALREKTTGNKITQTHLSSEEILSKRANGYSSGDIPTAEIMHCVVGYVLHALSDKGVGEDGKDALLPLDLFPDLSFTSIESFYEELAASEAAAK